MARTIANPIAKGYGAHLFHRRMINITFDGEWLRFELKSLTRLGKVTTLTLTPNDGWQQEEIDRYSVGLNVATGEFHCNCPIGSLGKRVCKHIDKRAIPYARSKGWLK